MARRERAWVIGRCPPDRLLADARALSLADSLPGRPWGGGNGREECKRRDAASRRPQRPRLVGDCARVRSSSTDAERIP